VDRPLIVNPSELPEPVGFAHAVVAGGAVYLGGQTGEGASLVVYTTDIEEYRASTRELGEAWRRHFGRRYPAMALIGVSALLEPEARVELMGVAVLDG
jgi:enamine deaminase RidA (YjgF/YER057c/UK114 family)